MAKNKMLQAVVSLAGTIDPSLGKALDDVTGKLENVNWKAVAVGGAVGGIAVATGKAVVEAGKYLADLGNEYNTAINQLSAATGRPATSWTRSAKASRTSTPKGSAMTSPTWLTVWLQRSRPAT